MRRLRRRLLLRPLRRHLLRRSTCASAASYRGSRRAVPTRRSRSAAIAWSPIAPRNTRAATAATSGMAVESSSTERDRAALFEPRKSRSTRTAAVVVRVAAVMTAGACLLARPAGAQTLSDVLSFLVPNQSVQTGSIERDRAAAAGASATISRALLANLATLPVATSSSGFVYRLNPELGTAERVTDSFGPFFVERALSAGKGQISLGLTFQQQRFTALDGHNLRDGSLVTTANQFRDESAPFDVDRLRLAIGASVATLYGNVGVTDRVEVGFAAPVVSLVIDGSRVNTYRSRQFTQATAHGRTVGLADVVVRTKVTAYREDRTALAAAVDVRLPTGRTEDLLGAGSASVKLSAIGS